MIPGLNFDDILNPKPGTTWGADGGKKVNLGPDFDPVNLSLKHLSKGKKVTLTLIFIVIVAFLYWLKHPAISIYSTDFWSFICIFVAIPMLVLCWIEKAVYKNGAGSIAPDVKKSKRFGRLMCLPIALFVFLGLAWLTSQSFFFGNAERYATVLKVDNLNFSEDIKEVNYSEVPVIDRDSAALLGNRAMGAIPEYVSQFEISPLYSQINLNAKPTRVSPLVYADAYKWFTNQGHGIPAYVKVDMATQDTEIVRLSEPIRYSQSELLDRNIDRYVQLKHPFYLFDQISFEVDDEGKPWWICPVQTRTISLFGGTDISRVVLVDATNGQTFDYEVKDCPQWVDRVYPADLLIEQYNWSGKYKDGWLNSWLGQQGVVQTTPGNDRTLGYNYLAKDDDVWVYTGVTSATADNSIVGFVLVNQRTHEAHFYSIAGATEESAMRSAEGQVQNLRYKATFPILLNINSQPTYFMALKDEAGLVKQYAMIDIQRYQNVAVGDSVAQTQKSYKQLLSAHGEASNLKGEGVKEATGTIRTMAQAVVEGNTHYYITLQGEGRIYDLALPAMLPIVAFAPGDSITLKYADEAPTAPVFEIVGYTSSQAASNQEGAIKDNA